MSRQPCPVEDAVDGLRAAARHVDDQASSDYGRWLVHVFAGTVGADWDLDVAIRFIETAGEVWWADHLLGHDLHATGDLGRTRAFDVRRPAGVVEAGSDVAGEGAKGVAGNGAVVAEGA